jgi:hypothetical protein
MLWMHAYLRHYVMDRPMEYHIIEIMPRLVTSISENKTVKGAFFEPPPLHQKRPYEDIAIDALLPRQK